MSRGRPRSKPILPALLCCAFASVLPLPARAQATAPDALEEARGWYRDGLSLEAAGDWSQALARFERVAEVRSTPQVRFHLGRCKEHLGRFTEALGDYRISEYEAERDQLRELAEITSARQSLEARVPKLEIVRGPGAERATIRLDGVALGQRNFGTEFGVDPGAHHVSATSPGAKAFERIFVAEEGQRTVVEVALEALPAAASSPEPAPLPQTDPTANANRPAMDRDAPEEASHGPWPLVLAGTGLAATGVGVFFLVERSRAIDEQAAHCVGSVCNEEFRSEVERAETKQTRSSALAVVAFSLAGASFAGAAWLWLDGDEGQARDRGQVRGRGSEARASLHVGAAVAESEWALTVGGRF